MTGHTVTAYVFYCDDCKQEWGADRQYQTAIEARAAAYGAGWRFPPRLTSKSAPSNQVEDVCPECLPSHQSTLTRLAAKRAARQS